MAADKRSSLADAIMRYVQPGCTVALEGFGHLVPSAATHEIVRQRIPELRVARMSCDALIDELIAAGCLRALVTSFVGNSSAGSLHELRRRVEDPAAAPLELQEYSHGGMIARYMAGAAKLPFMPIKSYAGSDLTKVNQLIRTVPDPYGGPNINVVPPLRPDVSILHSQRADRFGNVQAWGILGVQQEVAFAGRSVIVTVEEIVDEDVVRRDPNRTVIPRQIVDAVVACPGGSYPSSVQGYYGRDDTFLRMWSENARRRGAVHEWIETYVWGTSDHEEMLAKLGDPLSRRAAAEGVVALPVNYDSRQLRHDTVAGDRRG